MSTCFEETPYVRFDPDARAVWADFTGLTALDDNELDSAYERAHSFILKQLDELVIRHAWKKNVAKEDNLLLCLFPPDERELPIWNLIWAFALPRTFSEFVSASNPGIWGQVFEGLEAKRSNGNNDEIVISEPEPVANILYVLQCIAPGLVTLVGITAGEDQENKECARGLPPTNWLLRHATMLAEVLGAKEAYKQLLSTSKDPKKSFRNTTVSFKFGQFEEESFEEEEYDDYGFNDDNGRRTPNVSDSSSVKDFAACGWDCDYCGRCYY